MRPASSIRQDLVAARDTLRRAKDQLTIIQASTEHRLIEQAGGPKGLASNAEERTRTLTVLLAGETIYTQALEDVRDWEAKVEDLEAELADFEDERRRNEWAIRQRIGDALIALSVGNGQHNSGVTDGLDAAADRVVTAEASARSQVQPVQHVQDPTFFDDLPF